MYHLWHRVPLTNWLITVALLGIVRSGHNYLFSDPNQIRVLQNACCEAALEDPQTSTGSRCSFKIASWLHTKYPTHPPGSIAWCTCHFFHFNLTLLNRLKWFNWLGSSSELHSFVRISTQVSFIGDTGYYICLLSNESCQRTALAVISFRAHFKMCLLKMYYWGQIAKTACILHICQMVEIIFTVSHLTTEVGGCFPLFI